jgi:hypothetical protein
MTARRVRLAGGPPIVPPSQEKGGPKAALSRRAKRLAAHAGQSAPLASRKALVFGFATIVDVGGVRLGAGGEITQQK